MQALLLGPRPGSFYRTPGCCNRTPGLAQAEALAPPSGASAAACAAVRPTQRSVGSIFLDPFEPFHKPTERVYFALLRQYLDGLCWCSFLKKDRFYIVPLLHKKRTVFPFCMHHLAPNCFDQPRRETKRSRSLGGRRGDFKGSFERIPSGTRSHFSSSSTSWRLDLRHLGSCRRLCETRCRPRSWQVSWSRTSRSGER